jgi:hypothetical protein
MEPLAALSIASAVAQFLDFGAKLVSGTREIADTGLTVSTAHLSQLTTDLVEINASLEKQCATSTLKSGSSTIEEASLLELTTQCGEVASELVDCLKKITRNSDRGSTWTNVRKA